MTTLNESYNALKKSKGFLTQILLKPFNTWTAKTIKEEASNCLKHYPFLNEEGKPLWHDDELEDLTRRLVDLLESTNISEDGRIYRPVTFTVRDTDCGVELSDIMRKITDIVKPKKEEKDPD